MSDKSYRGKVLLLGGMLYDENDSSGLGSKRGLKKVKTEYNEAINTKIGEDLAPWKRHYGNLERALCGDVVAQPNGSGTAAPDEFSLDTCFQLFAKSLPSLAPNRKDTLQMIENLFKQSSHYVTRNLVIYFYGQADAATGDWLFGNGDTISLENILNLYNDSSVHRSVPLVIISDTSYSGRWAERFSALCQRQAKEPMVNDSMSVILQTSCGPNEQLVPLDDMGSEPFCTRFVQRWFDISKHVAVVNSDAWDGFVYRPWSRHYQYRDNPHPPKKEKERLAKLAQSAAKQQEQRLQSLEAAADEREDAVERFYALQTPMVVVSPNLLTPSSLVEDRIVDKQTGERVFVLGNRNYARSTTKLCKPFLTFVAAPDEAASKTKK